MELGTGKDSGVALRHTPGTIIGVTKPSSIPVSSSGPSSQLSRPLIPCPLIFPEPSWRSLDCIPRFASSFWKAISRPCCSRAFCPAPQCPTLMPKTFEYTSPTKKPYGCSGINAIVLNPNRRHAPRARWSLYRRNMSQLDGYFIGYPAFFLFRQIPTVGRISSRDVIGGWLDFQFKIKLRCLSKYSSQPYSERILHYRRQFLRVLYRYASPACVNDPFLSKQELPVMMLSNAVASRKCVPALLLHSCPGARPAGGRRSR